MIITVMFLIPSIWIHDRRIRRELAHPNQKR